MAATFLTQGHATNIPKELHSKKLGNEVTCAA